jgi:hypothetical protein
MTQTSLINSASSPRLQIAMNEFPIDTKSAALQEWLKYLPPNITSIPSSTPPPPIYKPAHRTV